MPCFIAYYQMCIRDSHYTDLKKVMRPREAIVTALNESFPTIFTSGSILASAGILISVLTTDVYKRQGLH